MAAWCSENLRSLADWRADGFDFSTTSDEAVKLYDALVRQVASLRECEQLGGFDGTMTKMLEADPTAIMPRVVQCGLNSFLSPPSPEILEVVEQLQKDAKAYGTDWEKAHVRAVDQLARRNLALAVETLNEILDSHPTDLLAAKLTTDGYLWLGDGRGIKNCVEKILPRWRTSTPCYSFLHGMLAFGLEECGQYREAEKEAVTALTLNRFDGWATHAKVHVLEMTHRYNEGIDFLEKTTDDWTGGFLLTHTLWHKGLFYVEKGDFETALSLYDAEISKNIIASKAVFSVVDATSLFLRLEMEGIPLGSRWKDLPDMSGHAEIHNLPFTDCHLPAFYLRRGEVEVEKKTHNSLVNLVRNGSSELAKVYEIVGLQLYEGMEDYMNGNYNEAVEKIYPVRDKIHRIGGSHAQRDLFSQILIDACVKSTKEEYWNRTFDLLEERNRLRLGNSSVGERQALRFRQKYSL